MTHAFATSALLLLIGYDLLIHLLHLLFGREFFESRGLVFWPRLYGRTYDLFWTGYWLLAFVLVLSLS